MSAAAALGALRALPALFRAADRRGYAPELVLDITERFSAAFDAAERASMLRGACDGELEDQSINLMAAVSVLMATVAYSAPRRERDARLAVAIAQAVRCAIIEARLLATPTIDREHGDTAHVIPFHPEHRRRACTPN
jgi:hypothetical protein